MKELVAKEIAKRVKDGEIIGIGTGSTVDAALAEIGTRIQKEGLKIACVPSSWQSAWKCQEIGISVMYPGYCGELAWGFDGADEVNDQRWLIKGRGGALLQEKILAKRCKKFVIIVDEKKVVSKLGANCAVPVEVVPEARSIVEPALKRLGATEVLLRQAVAKHGPVVTERGNLLLDAKFPSIEESLELRIKTCVGVVESGLFIGYADEVLVGGSDGIRML